MSRFRSSTARRLSSFAFTLLLGMAIGGCYGFIDDFKWCPATFNLESQKYQFKKWDYCEVDLVIQKCLAGELAIHNPHSDPPDPPLTPALCCNMNILDEEGVLIGNTKNYAECEDFLPDLTTPTEVDPQPTEDSEPSTTGFMASEASSSEETGGEDISTTDVSTSTSQDSTTSASTSDSPSVCGNGEVEREEQCDRGGCESDEGLCDKGFCQGAPSQACNGGPPHPQQVTCNDDCTFQPPAGDPAQG